MFIPDFISEECIRQGFERDTKEFSTAVEGMKVAWLCASFLSSDDKQEKPNKLDDFLALGEFVDEVENRFGFRMVNVHFANGNVIGWQNIES